MTPTQFLADHLAELDREALAAVAIVADVELKTARRAATGEPIRASDALCLFAARGYDPITLEQIPRKQIGAFNHQTLALFLNGHLRRHHLTERQAVAASGIALGQLHKMLNAERVSIRNAVKACVYLNIHPFDQCEKVREAA